MTAFFDIILAGAGRKVNYIEKSCTNPLQKPTISDIISRHFARERTFPMWPNGLAERMKRPEEITNM
jgi:hypothetical protein